MANYKEITNSFELPLYPKRDCTIMRGEGAYLWDDTGKQYIDCIAGAGSANVGHCNLVVVSAIQEQAAKLITCTGIFYNDTRAQLLEKLVEVSPKNLRQIFLCNSGAESIEAALKFARVSTKRSDFIATVRGFHGRTFGALSATHNIKYREGFEPLVPGFTHVAFNNFQAIEAACTDNTAGIIVEIVQGEGGVYLATEEYLVKVQELCRARGIMLIIDEVQTGFGRTGKMFACEHFSIEPDILCLAKSIAGGLPMGAVLVSDKITVHSGQHGTTFGGSPVVCAAAVATIDYIQKNNLCQNAEDLGNYFAKKLSELKLPAIREVRHLGLMLAIQLKDKSQPYLLKLMEQGVLALPAGPTVLRFLPPLVINKEQIDIVVEKVAGVLGE